jgi:hypothetical protein
MNCDNRLLTTKDVSTIQDKNLVKLSSILSESDRVQVNKFAVLLLEVDGEMFRTSNQLGKLVPQESTIVRDRSGQIVGIPTVSGG